MQNMWENRTIFVNPSTVDHFDFIRFLLFYARSLNNTTMEFEAKFVDSTHLYDDQCKKKKLRRVVFSLDGNFYIFKFEFQNINLVNSKNAWGSKLKKNQSMLEMPWKANYSSRYCRSLPFHLLFVN